MKTTILIINLLLITLSSCNSNDDNSFTPTLPPATQTGANTFGCYIDGNLLVPRDGDGTFNSPSHGVDYLASGDFPNYNSHAIIAHDYKENAGLIQIQIVDLAGRIQYNKFTNSKNISIEKGNLVNGSYILKITYNDGSISTNRIAFH